MIEATVLADALSKDGIGIAEFDDKEPRFEVLTNGDLLTSEEAITDWRVAGKVLESMSEGGCCSYFGHDTTDTYLCTYRKGWGHRRTRFHGVAVNPCTAIIEAWYESTYC